MELTPLGSRAPAFSSTPGQTQANEQKALAPNFSRSAIPSPISDEARRGGASAQPHSAHRVRVAPEKPATKDELIRLSQMQNIGNEMMQLEEGENLQFSIRNSKGNDVLCSVVKSDPNVVTIHHGEAANKMKFIKTPDGRIHTQWSNDKDQVIRGSHLRGAEMLAAWKLGNAACTIVRQHWGY